MITGIGSLPFTDVDQAIDLVFSTCCEAPFWPQLPRRAFMEGMYAQFLEGVPGVVFDREGESVYVDTDNTTAIEHFYEDFYEDRLDAFKLTEETAPGLYRLIERLPELGDQCKVIKGHITGPFTMGLGIKDRNGKAIIYDASYFDMIKKALHMKARWTISLFKDRFPEKDVIIFFDEPYMVSFGSAYVSVSKEDVVTLMNEVLDGLDATRGIHCCGNTDWSVLFDVHTDIINYDAVEYMDTIFYYKDELRAFLKRGGTIAPGIVPSSAQALSVSLEQVRGWWDRFLRLTSDVESQGDREYLLTPSCGLGSVNPEVAERAFHLLAEFSAVIALPPR
jgi:methionine synthase II (cobalamin-independent)